MPSGLFVFLVKTSQVEETVLDHVLLHLLLQLLVVNRFLEFKSVDPIECLKASVVKFVNIDVPLPKFFLVALHLTSQHLPLLLTSCLIVKALIHHGSRVVIGVIIGSFVRLSLIFPLCCFKLVELDGPRLFMMLF